MFIGHFAVGFASERVAPKTSLGTLMIAPLLLDMLWPLFLLLGIERVRIIPGGAPFDQLEFISYPWSHSLLMTCVWGAAFGLIVRATTRDSRGAIVVALGVVSHWVLDFVSHRPDLPLIPGAGPRVGLGLWNSPAATLLTESAIFVAGLWIYLATTRARDRIGVISRWSFVALIVLLYVGNVTGPPPPSLGVLTTIGIVSWLFTPWFYWIDRHREARAAKT
jgi:hypothetical protein